MGELKGSRESLGGRLCCSSQLFLSFCVNTRERFRLTVDQTMNIYLLRDPEWPFAGPVAFFRKHG